MNAPATHNTHTTIKAVKFKNFKALIDYSMTLHPMNILVGPNNSGKSTIISAFRALEVAVRRAKTRKAEPVLASKKMGHMLSTDALPLSTENVHSNLADIESRVEFVLATGAQLSLVFPAEGRCAFFAELEDGTPLTSPTEFRRAVPFNLVLVPILGPVEHNEQLVEKRTVDEALGSHRASRHFRNYWFQNRGDFEHSSQLVKDTWPGMEIELPQHNRDYQRPALNMVCREDRMAREIYWAGSGFQVWCQLLTHVVHASSGDLLVVDEPEIYLHPDVQRQLIRTLRTRSVDVLLATHSTEIMAEADPSEILLVEKKKKTARRLREIEDVQRALELVGSTQNITLTQLARNRRVLFMEGDEDIRIVQRYARQLGFSELGSGTGITPFPSGGFESWEKVKGFAWGLEKTVGEKLIIGCVYDRDY